MDRDRDLFRENLQDVVIEEGGDEDCTCGHVRDEHTDDGCMDCVGCIQFEEA